MLRRANKHATHTHVSAGSALYRKNLASAVGISLPKVPPNFPPTPIPLLPDADVT